MLKRAIHKNIVILALLAKIMRGNEEEIRYVKPREESDSVFDIDFDRLIKWGFTNFIFDVDNTIVPACQKNVADDVVEIFKHLAQNGCHTCIVSNNAAFHVRKIANQLDTSYIASAGKPFESAYLAALENMDAHPLNTVFIGDQMLTDIFGGNKIGLYTILTGPIDRNASALVSITIAPQTLIKKLYDKKVNNC